MVNVPLIPFVRKTSLQRHPIINFAVIWNGLEEFIREEIHIKTRIPKMAKSTTIHEKTQFSYIANRYVHTCHFRI